MGWITKWDLEMFSACEILTTCFSLKLFFIHCKFELTKYSSLHLIKNKNKRFYLTRVCIVKLEDLKFMSKPSKQFRFHHWMKQTKDDSLEGNTWLPLLLRFDWSTSHTKMPIVRSFRILTEDLLKRIRVWMRKDWLQKNL
jgi:hypothetical protein